MSCKKYHLLISRNIDNDLNNKEKDILLNHLSKCIKCKQKENQFLQVKNILRSPEENLIKFKFNQIRDRKKFTLLKTSLSFAAIIIIVLITGIIVFKSFSNNSTNKNNIINYPLGSIVYYERNSSGNNMNYYIPISTYFSEEENK